MISNDFSNYKSLFSKIKTVSIICLPYEIRVFILQIDNKKQSIIANLQSRPSHHKSVRFAAFVKKRHISLACRCGVAYIDLYISYKGLTEAISAQIFSCTYFRWLSNIY